MAMDVFLKLQDITGEAEDAAHSGEIDILAWSWGMSQSGSAHVGGGSGAGKVSVQDVSFTKYVDKASTPIMVHCCKGTHIPLANLVIRKAGGDPHEYWKLEMTNCFITSISTGGSGGEDALTENITLSFEKFKSEYVPQKEDGSADAGIVHTWNVLRNVEE